MSENNPDQLRMDFNHVDPHFQELCDNLGISVDEVDRRADSMGSYGDAWRSFGALQSQIDELYRGPSDSGETSSKVVDDEVKTTETDASVNIREKASHILYAGRNLAEANGKKGLIYAIETDHPSVRGKYNHSDIPRLSIKANRCMTIGKNALRNAYGDPEALVEIGFDRSEVESDMEDNEREFDDKYIGPNPEQKKNLAKLRKNQKRILK